MSSEIMFRNTYIQNVKEYFKNKKIIDTSDDFEKGIYELYKMSLNNESENVINEQIKYINSLPVSYWKLRSVFG
jgi:predicted nucleotide-binding protein (sugar kinase/HSP70/actin superfamily)